MAGYLYAPDVKRAANDQVWFRYRQQEVGVPEIRVYTTGVPALLQKTIDGLGSRPAGEYASRSRAIFWDTKDTGGSPLGPGTYVAILYIDAAENDKIRFTLP